ncbi:MAG: LPS export ABC transporter periplasmic protein LptC [Desulfobaccales bacterium]|jgi:LPS export ABC transporter protein LptC
MKILVPKNGAGAWRLPRWSWAALLVMVVGLGAWGLEELNRPAPPPPKPPPAAAQSRMETLSLTEIQDGDKRWVLVGQKADISKDQGEVNLTGVRVEFFGPGEHLKVKADEGLFHTKTRILTLTGNVEMEQGDLLVKTSVATYDPNARVLVSPEEVILSNPTLRIKGKGLRVWLAEKRMVLSQHQLTEIKVQEGTWRP